MRTPITPITVALVAILAGCHPPPEDAVTDKDICVAKCAARRRCGTITAPQAQHCRADCAADPGEPCAEERTRRRAVECLDLDCAEIDACLAQAVRACSGS